MAKSIKGVELFAPGKWNHQVFTKEDVAGIALAFITLKEVFKIPLKFGHNNKQKLTDGQPALGWVTNVYVEGDKLVADFEDMPDIVYSSMFSKLYNALSIELEIDVDYKGQNFPYVLSGVALLGADLPAVNTLKDLSSYLPERLKELSRSAHFSFSNNSPKEDQTMTEEEKKEMERLKAQNKALQASLDQATTENVQFSTAAKTAQEQLAAKAKEDAKVAFASKKASLTERFNKLVEVKHITPAQRDKAFSKIKEGEVDSLELVEDAYEMMSMGADVTKFSKDDKAKDEDKSKASENEGKSADVIVLSRVKALRATEGGASLTFSAAAKRVLEADPELAKDYVNLTKEV